MKPSLSQLVSNRKVKVLLLLLLTLAVPLTVVLNQQQQNLQQQAAVSGSKLGIYAVSVCGGANTIIDGGPKILKVSAGIPVHPDFIKMLRNYKNKYPDGITVLRIYDDPSVNFTAADNPEQKAQEYYDRFIKPAWDSVSDKGAVDWIAGDNEFTAFDAGYDASLGFNKADSWAWYGRFWAQLAEITKSRTGKTPVVGEWAVGNPIDPTFLTKMIDPLHRIKNAGGVVSYHGYTRNYTTNEADEADNDSLYYRRLHDAISSSGLGDLRFMIGEAGVDENGDADDGWQTHGDANKYKNWLQWYDGQLKRDGYNVGATLFQVCDTTPRWWSFEISPIADWLKGYLGGTPAGGDPGDPGGPTDPPPAGDGPGTIFIQLKNPNGNPTTLPAGTLYVARDDGGAVSGDSEGYNLAGSATQGKCSKLPETGRYKCDVYAAKWHGGIQPNSIPAGFTLVDAGIRREDNEPSKQLNANSSIQFDVIVAASDSGGPPAGGGQGTLTIKIVNESTNAPVQPTTGTLFISGTFTGGSNDSDWIALNGQGGSTPNCLTRVSNGVYNCTRGVGTWTVGTGNITDYEVVRTTVDGATSQPFSLGAGQTKNIIVFVRPGTGGPPDGGGPGGGVGVVVLQFVTEAGTPVDVYNGMIFVGAENGQYSKGFSITENKNTTSPPCFTKTGTGRYECSNRAADLRWYGGVSDTVAHPGYTVIDSGTISGRDTPVTVPANGNVTITIVVQVIGDGGRPTPTPGSNPSYVPNCSNIQGPTTIRLGQTATYLAQFSGPTNAGLSGTINAFKTTNTTPKDANSWEWHETDVNKPNNNYPPQTVQGNSGVLTYKWTPESAGVYQVFCRAWNVTNGNAECRGASSTYDPANMPPYGCTGPGAVITVNVTNAAIDDVASTTDMCQAAITIGGNVMALGGASANPNAPLTVAAIPKPGFNIKTYSFAFYNMDNQPSDPKPIFFEPGKQFVVDSASNTITLASNTFNKPDLNFGGNKPKNIQIQAFFTDVTGTLSAKSPNCVTSFKIVEPVQTLAPTVAPTATPSPATDRTGLLATIGVLIIAIVVSLNFFFN